MPSTAACPSADDFHTSLSEAGIRPSNGLNEKEQNWVRAVVISEFDQKPLTGSFDCASLSNPQIPMIAGYLHQRVVGGRDLYPIELPNILRARSTSGFLLLLMLCCQAMQ